MHLDQAFLHQGLKAKTDRAEPNTHILGQCTLINIWYLIQTAQNLRLNFLLETSQFLNWEFKTQSNLVRLPLCRLTIIMLSGYDKQPRT